MSLNFKVDGNASGFFQVLNQVKTHATHVSKEITSEVGKSWGGIGKSFIGGVAGALSFEAAKSTLESFLDRAKGVRDLAEIMEMGADATQRWGKSAERAGFSFGTMQTALTGIFSKRQDALTDPKAAKIFEDMGIARSIVRDSKGTDNSEFARMVLDAAGKSDQNRALLESIVGKRAAGKAIAAGREFGGTTADISPESMASAQKSEEAMRMAHGWVDKGISWIISKTAAAGEAMGDVSTMFGGNAVKSDHVNYGRLPIKERNTSPPKDEIDEAELKRKEKEKERAEKDIISADRIEAAKRQNMKSAQKRASMEKELADIQDRKLKAEKEQAPEYLEQLGREDELAEWQTKQKDKIADLAVREQGLIGDLKQKETPLALPQSGLGKSGLFSGVQIQPVTGGGTGDMRHEEDRSQRDMLTELRQINRNTRDGGPSMRW